MRKINKELRQKTIDYALFMISSSYFSRQPKCLNPYMEARLFLYYQEALYRTQIETEEKCIHYMEKELLPVLPLDLWEIGGNQNDITGCVHMYPLKRYGVTVICYETGQYVLRLMGRYSELSHKTEFTYQFVKKR